MRLLAVIAALLPLAAGAETIVSARYADPTDRYDHGVLGDAIEWGTLEVTFEDGTRRRFILPEERVFEDIEPRLADLDGDGAPEVITVESHINFGARLSVWDSDGPLASNEWIGRRHRWLAPIGAADLDGDGAVEIAFVDRPHLAKELAIYRYVPGSPRLVFLTSVTSFTNHRIGDDFISGGIRNCDGKTYEMIVASGDWREILAVTYGETGPRARTLGTYRGKRSLEKALRCGRNRPKIDPSRIRP